MCDDEILKDSIVHKTFPDHLKYLKIPIFFLCCSTIFLLYNIYGKKYKTQRVKTLLLVND